MTKMKVVDPAGVAKLVDLALSKKIHEIIDDYEINTVIVTLCAMSGTLAAAATKYDREALAKFLATLFWVLEDTATFELEYGNSLRRTGDVQA